MCDVHWGGPNANLVVYILEKVSRLENRPKIVTYKTHRVQTQFPLCVLNGVSHGVLTMRNRQDWVYSPRNVLSSFT